MGNSGKRKLREKRARRIAARHQKESSLLPFPAAQSSAAENSHNKKTNDRAKQETQQNANSYGSSWETRLMSGFILTIMGIICGGLIAIAITYWSKGGYQNLKISS